MPQPAVERLITYDDLSVCEYCLDFWCPHHDDHFYDCPCYLEVWLDDLPPEHLPHSL